MKPLRSRIISRVHGDRALQGQSDEHPVALWRWPSFLLLLTLGFRPVAFGQSALELASRVDQHYNNLHAVQVQFMQQYDGLGQHRRERGTLLLKKPGRMRWDYSQPAGKLFVLDGQNAYFYSPGQREVQRVPAKKLDDLRSPLRFLLGHAQLAKELSNLHLSGNNGGFELTGVPKGMESRVQELTFTVSMDGVILGIKVEEVDGSTSVFQFTNEVKNPAAPDSYFTFHPPPGTVIVNGLPPA